MSELADSKPSGRKSPMSPAPKLPKLKTKKKEVPAEEKTSRSPWKRYIVWAVMALLVLGVVAEFRAQLGFRKTLATCNGAFENVEGKTPADIKRITFDELKAKLPPDPVHTKEVHSFAQSDVYTWTWQGIRRYKVQLFVNPKDGAVWDVNSEP
jgi:hypothetical protein